MNTATLTWFTIAACVAYVLAVDANVLDGLVLLSRRLGIELRRQWYMVRYHPESPWVRYEVNRNANKLATDLIKEYESRSDNK